MLSDQDMTRLKKTFTTKGELAALGKRLINHMAKQFAIHLSPILTRLDAHDEKFQALDEKFDRVMTIVDRVFAPIDELRLEAAVSAAQYRLQVEWNHEVAKKSDVPFDY